MTYLIYNHKTGDFVGSTQKETTPDITKACKFGDVGKAANFHKAGLSRVPGVESIHDWVIISGDAARELVNLNSYLAGGEDGELRRETSVLEQKTKPVRHKEPEVEQALGTVAEISGLAKALADKVVSARKVLAETLSWQDCAEQDLLHKSENENLNVVEGFKMYKAMQALRQQRRKVKDGLRTLLPFTVAECTHLFSVSKTMESIELSTDYTPRVMPELFEQPGIGDLADFQF